MKKENLTASPDVIAYIQGFEGSTRSRLEEIRHLILELVPGVQEYISYAMPSFRVGKTTLHMAGYKKHIGMYPAPEPADAEAWGLSSLVTGPGTLQFRHDRDLPLLGIKKWILARLGSAGMKS